MKYKEEIYKIITYHGDEGTSGYALTDEQVDKIVELIEQSQEQQTFQMVKIERFVDECIDKEFGTFDYELFGEKVFDYFRSQDFKKFRQIPLK